MKIGDIVAVEEPGQTYTSYAVWAERNNLTRWQFTDGYDREGKFVPQFGLLCRIVAIDVHTRPDQKDTGFRNLSDILYGIEDLKTRQQYIIHNAAVYFVRNGEAQLELQF